MPNQHTHNAKSNQPFAYQIRLEGHLGLQWTDWFEAQSITLQDDGNTLLTGLELDQAALYGLLRKVRDVGLPLISVKRIEPDQTDNMDIQ